MFGLNLNVAKAPPPLNYFTYLEPYEFHLPKMGKLLLGLISLCTPSSNIVLGVFVSIYISLLT